MSLIVDAVTRIVLLPPTNLIVFMLAGLALRRRFPRAGRALAGLSVLALVVFATGAGSLLLVRPLEQLTAPLTRAQTRDAHATGAQAIVVLGAGSITAAPEYGHVDIPDEVALMRLRYAAHLQHATGLPLLVTGGNGTRDGRVQAKAIGMARALRDDFRTPVAWIEPASKDTEQNARFSARILRAAGIKRILLVTHAMHMARASAAFTRAGMEVVEAPTVFYSGAKTSFLSYLPGAYGLYRTYYASHEWIGLAWYRLRALRGDAAAATHDAALPAQAAPASPAVPGGGYANGARPNASLPGVAAPGSAPAPAPLPAPAPSPSLPSAPARTPPSIARPVPDASPAAPFRPVTPLSSSIGRGNTIVAVLSPAMLDSVCM